MIFIFSNFNWPTFREAYNHESGYTIETSPGCYVIATMDNGDTGGYQSFLSYGYYDFWMVKLCDSSYLLPPISALGLPQSICPGSCIYFENNSSFAWTYQWFFPGGLPDTSTLESPSNICYANPGSYNVTLVTSNLNGNDTLTLQNYITVFPQPAPQSITQSDDTLFAIAGATSYQWYYNGNLIPGATDYFYVATASGDYNIVATDVNGCEVEAVINDVLAHTLLAVGYWPLAVYPNPVTSTIYIQGLKNNSADEIKIFNVFGDNIFSAAHCLLSTVNCLLFPAGLYYIQITSDKNIYRTKFVKQ